MQLAQDGSLLAKLSGLSRFFGAIPWIFGTIPDKKKPGLGASPPYIGVNIGAKLRSMPRITSFVLLLGVGLILLNCTKKIDGNTSFKEATKGFQKELTKDQRKSAIEQLQTETAGKP